MTYVRMVADAWSELVGVGHEDADGDLPDTDRVVLGGPCVLRDGPAILRNLGEESKL